MKTTELTFQAIVESTPSAIILVNSEGKIACANRSVNVLFGYDNSELYGEYVERLIPDRHRKGHQNFREGFFEEFVGRPMGAGYDLYAIKKDGTEFPVEIGLSPLVTVDGAIVLVSIIDITERKKAEEKFRRVLDAAPISIILVNTRGEIAMVNNRALDQFKYNRRELVGEKIEMLIPMRFRKDHSKLREDFFSVPLERSLGDGRDFYALRKNGTEFPVEIGLAPITMGNENYVITSVIDITGRKMQESKIKEYLDEVKAKNKELEQFSSLVSYVLQKPLRSVSNFVDLLKEEYGDKLEGNAQNYIKYSAERIARINSLVNGFLDYLKLGQQGLGLEEVDCIELVHDVFDGLNGVVPSTNAQMEMENLPKVQGHKTGLRLLFENLVSNAIKFRKEGMPPYIGISCGEMDGFWKFCVKDNGIGIAKGHQDKIFHDFQQFHDDERYNAIGVGLSYCKKIVGLHGGTYG